jgi:hypothetical protein
MLKKMLFIGGFVSGAVLTGYWRTVAKQGIKLGIQAGGKIGEIAQKAREELEDVTAEATEELSPKQKRTRRELEN